MIREFLPESGVGAAVLEAGGDVSREDREENHADGGEHDGKDLPDLGDAKNIGADGGDVHQGPIESIPVVFDLGIHLVFQEEEEDAGEINGGEQDGEIGDEQVGDFVTTHPPHDEGDSLDTSHDRDEAENQPDDVRFDGLQVVENVQVGDGHDQEKKVPEEKVTCPSVRVPTDKEVGEENEANGEVNLQAEPFAEDRVPVEHVDGHHHDDGDTTDEYKGVEQFFQQLTWFFHEACGWVQRVCLFPRGSSQWNGAISASGFFHEGLRTA